MKIFAHRGASGEFPENTLLAFEEAIKQGSDGIELDVQFHQASEEFIVIHDRHIKHANQIKHINALTFSQISQITLRQQGIPTLTQALACINNRCIVNIEIKSASQGMQLSNEIIALKRLLTQLVESHVISYDKLIISSFNHHVIKQSSQQLPSIQTAALIAGCPILYASFCTELSVAYLNVSAECLNKVIIQDAHQKGLKVFVYTVDLIDEIKLCHQLGVDGIFTNFPARALHWLTLAK